MMVKTDNTAWAEQPTMITQSNHTGRSQYVTVSNASCKKHKIKMIVMVSWIYIVTSH